MSKYNITGHLREREREGGRQTDRGTHTDRETERGRQRQRYRDTDRKREGGEDRQIHRYTDRHTDTQTDTYRQRQREYLTLFVPNAVPAFSLSSNTVLESTQFRNVLTVFRYCRFRLSSCAFVLFRQCTCVHIVF